MHPTHDSISSASSIDPASEVADSAKTSLDELTLDIITIVMKSFQERTAEKATDLNERQKVVAKLQSIIAKLNAMPVEKGGKVTVSDDFLMLLDEAKTLVSSIDGPEFEAIKPEKGKTYSGEEREKLIENVRITIENLNTDNETLLQQVQQLRNNLFEILKMANDISNKLDAVKKKMVNNIK